MRINISALIGKKGKSFRVREELKSDFLETAPEVKKVLSPITVELTVSNTQEGFLVVGELEVRVKLQCSRCLRHFDSKLVAAVQEEFQNAGPRLTNADGDEFMAEEIPLVEGNELDLTGLIRESAFMSIPMKSICEPSCPGLCPVCGIRLAEESCDCLSPDVDIRMTPLQELLEASERRKENGSTKKKTFQSKD